MENLLLFGAVESMHGHLQQVLLKTTINLNNSEAKQAAAVWE